MLDKFIFLETAPQQISGSSLAGIFAILMAFFFLFVIISIAFYIYTSLALMSIARKTNTENGWFAFIPILNFYLMAKIAKKSWWPILICQELFFS